MTMEQARNTPMQVIAALAVECARANGRPIAQPDVDMAAALDRLEEIAREHGKLK